MKRLLSVMVSSFILLGSIPLAAAARPADPAFAGRKVAHTLYVSAIGSDRAGDGSAAAPFATVEKARDTVRTLDKTQGDIVVKIAGGYYPLKAPLVFDERDSGSETGTIYYEAADEASPVISGGKLVESEWEVAGEVDWLDDGLTAYKTAWTRDDKLRAIYVNGERAAMTRRTTTPLGAAGTYTVTKDQADWAWIGGSKAAGTVFAASFGLPADTRNPQNIELEAAGSVWTKSTVCAASLERDGDGGTQVHFQMPFAAIAQTPGWKCGYSPTAENTVYNVFEWLSRPGEFYFDQAGGTLYYIPKAGEDMATAQVVVPELETLVEVKGTNPKQDYARYITFRGLTFAHTDWNLTEIDGSHGLATVQACTMLTKFSDGNWHNDLYRAYDVPPAAIHVTTAHDITVSDSTVALTGSLGIHLENDVYDCTVTGNTIGKTGGAGVVVGHPQHGYENDTALHQVKGAHAGADKEKFQSGTEAAPVRIFIRNNYLPENAGFFPGHAPITAFYTRELWVEHNFIYKCPYSGMSIGWGWCNFDGDPASQLPGVPTAVSKNNHINYNRIEEICALRHDGGGIYTLGQMGNDDWTEASQANGNYINCFRGASTGGAVNGFHPDEGSAYITFDSNVITNTANNVYELNDWQRKHDLIVTNGYANSSKSVTTAPGCSLEQYVNAGAVWPASGHDVVLYAGLEDAYTHLVEKDILPDDVYELASHVRLAPGETLHRRGLLEHSDEVWLAPAGTTAFAESSAMTKAAGDAKEMAAPAAAGEYKLYIRYADGRLSAPSAFTLYVVEGKELANVAAGQTYDVCKRRPLTLTLDTDTYKFWLNDRPVTTGDTITAAGEWILKATPYSGGTPITLAFATVVSPANRLLPEDVMMGTNSTLTFAEPLHDASKTIWLAPSGVTAFDESDPAQVKAAGDSLSMPVPAVPGDYILTAVQADGSMSRSEATLSVRDVPSDQVPLDGLGLWLAADKGVTLSPNGSAVETWNSQWGAAALKPAAPSEAPTLSVNEHGAPALSFDGVNDTLSVEGMEFNGKSELTIITVTRYGGPSNGLEGYGDRYAALFVPETGSWGSIIVAPYHDQVVTRFGAGQSMGFDRYVRPADCRETTVAVSVKNGATEQMYVDGEKAGTWTGRKAATANNGDTLYLGKSISGGRDYFFKGMISEILIYDRALTEDEIRQIDSYLGAKYRGELPALESIAVAAPEKTRYQMGEELDLATLTITARYSDGRTKPVQPAACTISGFDAAAPGLQTVTIRYTEEGVTKEASFEVEVVSGIPGDVNGNGEVEAADALMALQAATDKIRLTEPQRARADVDTTPGVSAGDALLILQKATRKITRFPAEIPG